jgi:hypothetical protein
MIEQPPIDVHFPFAGLFVSCPYSNQPNLQIPTGDYARTTPLGINVRAFEPGLNRKRGGSRPGLARYISTPVVAGWMNQELNILTTSGTMPVQTSQSGRVVFAIAVNQGKVYYAEAGATSWTLATNNTANSPPLNAAGIMQSAANNQLLYFADGVHWCYFDPATTSVQTWMPLDPVNGPLPVDSSGNKPRLICTWRGRTVLGGLLFAPQDLFFSAVGDPTNFIYSPTSTTPTQAVSLIASPQGIVGDVVTGICPYTDDVLVIFCDHSIYLMNGDPMAGGQLDLVSDSIGGVWGIPWCKDPLGNIYFFSNRTGIYTMVPGQQPQRISQAIEYLLSSINTGANNIRLIWDDFLQGLHVFVSTEAAPPLLGATPDTHFFYEARAGAWFQDQFANPNHNPLCCCTFDGNTPGDRVVLIGSWDGYVRSVSATATNDDGWNINSQVLLGPIVNAELDDFLLKQIIGVLGASSGQVNYNVYVGESAQEAYNSGAIATGTWSAGRNPALPIRRSGHAIYVGLTSSNPWQMEQIRLLVATQGKVRARSR